MRDSIPRALFVALAAAMIARPAESGHEDAEADRAKKTAEALAKALELNEDGVSPAEARMRDDIVASLHSAIVSLTAENAALRAELAARPHAEQTPAPTADVPPAVDSTPTVDATPDAKAASKPAKTK